MPTANEFLCVGKKIADGRTAYLFILGNVSDLESDICGQKISCFLILFFSKSELYKSFLLLSC